MIGTVMAARLPEITIDTPTLARIKVMYGSQGTERIRQWLALIERLRHEALPNKLRITNAFFNQLTFRPDVAVWGVEDYWATPIEMLGVGAGDCEDFSVAKFFTLWAAGVPESQLRLTYVTATTLNQAHMVLTWYPDQPSEPLVLDNLVDEVLPASQRSDLIPVYSFNASKLWLARERFRGQELGAADRIEVWQRFLDRLNAQLSGKFAGTNDAPRTKQ